VIDPRTLRAQADRVLELHETGRLDEALKACARLLAEVADDPLDDVVVRESVFTARFEQGVLLTELGDLAGAAEAYADAAMTPTDVDDPDQRHELAMALLNQGICLDALEDHEGALRVYDQLVERLGDAEDPVTADQVVRGRVNRAAALLATGSVEEALAAAEALRGELDPTDVLGAEQRVMAARLQASALCELGRRPEALTVLQDAERCNGEEPAARLQIVAAAGERARILLDLGRGDEALEVLERVAHRYVGDEDPDVAGDIEGLLAVEADALEARGDHDGAARLRQRLAG
jgi:tetratricopeptide (TPR) repeat protein